MKERVRKVKVSTTQPPIIYFNIGWMKRYDGVAEDDKTQGGHGYLKGHRHGGEAFNFSKCEDGKVRGHRPPGSSEKTNIAKMGANKEAAEISGALVVWIAKKPASLRSLIVGWYRNATVYREARSSNITLNGHEIFYSAEAAASDAVLLPPLIRTFQVASSRTNPGAGFGQKPTWYGAKEVDKRVGAGLDKAFLLAAYPNILPGRLWISGLPERPQKRLAEGGHLSTAALARDHHQDFFSIFETRPVGEKLQKAACRSLVEAPLALL